MKNKRFKKFKLTKILKRNKFLLGLLIGILLTIFLIKFIFQLIILVGIITIYFGIATLLNTNGYGK